MERCYPPMGFLLRLSRLLAERDASCDICVPSSRDVLFTLLTRGIWVRRDVFTSEEEGQPAQDQDRYLRNDDHNGMDG